MKHLCLSLLVATLASCSLINSKSLSYDYDFDPQPFTANLGKASSGSTVPTVPCSSSNNTCAEVPLPSDSVQLACDSTRQACVATADVRLSAPIDLSHADQKLPADVLQYGASHVSIERIAYWIVSNTVNVQLPPIDLYVAASAAKDEHDQSAVFIGTVTPPPARGSSCVDQGDLERVPAAGNARVCVVPLTLAGQTALANFAHDYKTPFQIIVHTHMAAPPGVPVPEGAISFYVQPTVSFSILK